MTHAEEQGRLEGYHLMRGSSDELAAVRMLEISEKIYTQIEKDYR